MLKALERKERRATSGVRKKRPDRRTRQKQRMKHMAKTTPGHDLLARNVTRDANRTLVAKRGSKNATAFKNASLPNQVTDRYPAPKAAKKGAEKGGMAKSQRQQQTADSVDEDILFDERGNPLPRGLSRVIGMPGTKQPKQMTEIEALQDYCKGGMLEPVFDDEGNIKWVDRRTEEEQEEAERIAEARERALDRGITMDSSEDVEKVMELIKKEGRDAKGGAAVGLSKAHDEKGSDESQGDVGMMEDEPTSGGAEDRNIVNKPNATVGVFACFECVCVCVCLFEFDMHAFMLVFFSPSCVRVCTCKCMPICIGCTCMYMCTRAWVCKCL